MHFRLCFLSLVCSVSRLFGRGRCGCGTPRDNKKEHGLCQLLRFRITFPRLHNDGNKPVSLPYANGTFRGNAWTNDLTATPAIVTGSAFSTRFYFPCCNYGRPRCRRRRGRLRVTTDAREFRRHTIRERGMDRPDFKYFVSLSARREGAARRPSIL